MAKNDTDKKGKTRKISELRRQAERTLRFDSVSLHHMSEADVAALVHELRVHEIELQMQNESLREAQVELEASRTTYADLFDFAPVGYLVVDPKGIIRESNLTAASMLGVERGRLADSHFANFLSRASGDPWRLHYHAVFESGKPQETELEIKHEEDQPPMFVRVRSRPVQDAQGKVVQCHTAMIDITAQLRAERRLKESERCFRTLAENSPDIIVRIDRDMRVLYANKPVENTLRMPPERLIGHTFEELGVPEAMDTLWTDAIQKVFRTGKPGRTDFSCSLGNGIRHHSAAIVPEFDDDRTIRTVLVTVRDVTERVRAEEMYSTVIRSLQDGFCIIDAEGRYREANETCCRMLERTREELSGLTVLDTWEIEQQDQIMLHLHKAREQGWDKFLIRRRRKDGSQVDCDITVQRLEGNHFFLLARDVTEPQRAEQQRRETLQRLQLVAKATNDGIWDWDLETDTLWHNAAYATVYGYPADESCTSPQWWRERIHPEDRDRVLAVVEDAVKDGTDRWEVRYRFRRQDGSYAWVVARAYVLRDDEGKAVRMVGSVLDMTEKLDLLDQLESERTMLATILDTALAGIVVVNERGGLSYANPAAQRLHAQPMPPSEDLESHQPMGLFHLDGTPCEPRDLPLVRSALYGETHGKAELLIKRPDGETRHIAFNTSPLADREGKTTGAVAVIQDITELKAAEQALCAARDELERRVRERTAELDRTVATLHEEVAEKERAQKQLTRQNETLQTIINNIPVMLVFSDERGNVGMVNDELRQKLAYSLEDFRDNKILELCYPDPQYRQDVWDYVKRAEPGWRDFLVRKKDGGELISSWATVRLSDGSYLGIGIDISERRRWENRLRESEERYRTLVELSPDAIGVERDGTIQFVNSTAVKLLGAKSADDLVGRPVLDLLHPDYRKRIEQQFKYLGRKRKPLPPTEEKIVRLDGAALDVELAAMPIMFEGKPANQIVVHDITQRRQVEQRLRQSARQLEQQAELLDLAHDSIVVNDMEGRITFWSRGAEQTYGWSRDEAIGRISHDLLETRFPVNLIEVTAKLLSRGRWSGELTQTTRSRQTIIVSSRWALQRDENSRPTGILVIDRDVTQRKRAEQARTKAMRLAESITNTIRESLLVLDRNLKVFSANQTFHDTFQVTPEETKGRYIYEIGHGQWDIPELRRLLEDILPKNSSFEDFEVEHDFPNIGARTMLLNARRICRETQETEMILLAIQDITFRKEQENKIRESGEQLAALTEQLLLAEERERHRIALLLHDSIGQYLSFSKRELGVLQRSVPDQVQEGINYVREQIEEAIRQTRDLTFELSPTTLHTFGLEAAVEELADQYAERGGFQYDFSATDDDKPLSEQMKVLLFRAAREMLMNITKHAEASDVHITIERRNGTIYMVFEDNGKGFDVARLDEVVRSHEGFGLFSIRERLTHVGGVLDIESQPGQGTTVTLIAPLEPTNKVNSRSGKS